MRRLVPVLIAAAVLAGAAGWRIAFDDDEFQHAHMAWLMARGEVPYRDFFEHHVPLHHLVLAPLTLGRPGPSRILVLRGFHVAIFLAWLGSLAWALRRWKAGTGGIILALTWCAVSPIFLLKMIEVRPDGLSILLGTIAFGLLAAPARPLVAGIVAGAMVMATQKFVFLGIGLGAVAWALHGLRGAWRYSVGAFVAPVLVAAWLARAGAGPAAWEALVMMNLGWQETFSPAGYASQFWVTSAPLIVLGLAGAAVAWSDSETRRAGLAAAILTLSGVAAVLWIPIPFRQTYLMLAPGLALGAAMAVGRLGAAPGLASFRHAGIALVVAGALPGLAGLRHEFKETLDADLALMREIDATTEGPVFDGRRLVHWRHHAGRFGWFHEGLLMMLDEDDFTEETVRSLREADYPPLLWDYRFEYLPDALLDVFRAHYVPSEPDPLWRPGLRVERGRLAGTGAVLDVPAPGRYRVQWSGGAILIDGEPVEPGQVLVLGPEPFRVTARGFVRELTLTRVGGVP